MDYWTDGTWMDRWTEGWMDAWMGEWAGGWAGRWMRGWVLEVTKDGAEGRLSLGRKATWNNGSHTPSERREAQTRKGSLRQARAEPEHLPSLPTGIHPCTPCFSLRRFPTQVLLNAAEQQRTPPHTDQAQALLDGAAGVA